MLWTESDNKQVLHMACANGTLVNISGRNKIVPNDGLDHKESSESLDESMDFETQPPLIIPSTGRKRIGKSNGEKDESGEQRGKLETQPAFAAEPGRKRIVKNTVNNDESDDDVDFETETTAAKASSKKSSSFVADEAEEGIDDDEEDGESASARGKENGNYAGEDNDDEDLLGEDYDGYVESRPLLQAASLPEPQPPFAPSATPLDLPRRIMCWNHLGTVSYLRDDDGITRNTVDIDFTDAATRRPMTFTDNMNFILGSIGEDGAIFASDVTDDDDREGDDDDDVGKLVDGLAMSEKTKALVRRSHNKRMHKSDAKRSTGSNVYFHRFETFGPMRDKDWLLTLPDGERATGCACGEGWAAVITRYACLPFFLLH
jgi:chromosome transmission fidelity protein 4